MELSAYKNVYVIAETRDGKVQDVSYQLLGKGREIADKTHSSLHVILAGYNIKNAAQDLIAHGADEVIVIDSRDLQEYLTEPYVQAVYSVVEERKPNIILVGATSIGRDLAPRLSARLRTGLTADCTKLEVEEDGSLFMTRPAFGGNLMATIISPNHRPQMSTVRPGVMKKLEADSQRKGTVTNVTFQLDRPKSLVEIVKVIRKVQSSDRIEDAKILVSVGRGICQETYPLAVELAKVLKGTISGSRASVDCGTIEQARQVGQTGKTVRPNLYIALGVSGAIQHLAGMEESDFIVAINKDRYAPIFKVADVGIVGDIKQVVPALIEEIKKYKQ